jgi:hypothetical protein
LANIDHLGRAERLKQARLKRGFRSARTAAEYLNIPYGTYLGHEGGTRGIKEADLVRYASAFRVTASWLAFGQETGSKKLKIIGVAADLRGRGDLGSYQDHEIDIAAPFPVSSDSKAILVSTSDYEPILFPNDLVILGQNCPLQNAIGFRVALLVNGKWLLGVVVSMAQGQRCHFQLLNGKIMTDVLPDEAAPIIGTINHHIP